MGDREGLQIKRKYVNIQRYMKSRRLTMLFYLNKRALALIVNILTITKGFEKHNHGSCLSQYKLYLWIRLL